MWWKKIIPEECYEDPYAMWFFEGFYSYPASPKYEDPEETEEAYEEEEEEE